MSASEAGGAHGPGPRDDRPQAWSGMDDERCLFVLGLLRDGRPVDGALAAAAQAHLAARPRLQRVQAQLERISEVVATLKGPAPSADFSARVLAARADALRRARTPPASFVLRLSAAAALVLSVALFFDASRPQAALADPATDQQHFPGDAFRPEPYAPVDLEAGLRTLLPGPLDLREGRAPPPTGAEAGGADESGPSQDGQR